MAGLLQGITVKHLRRLADGRRSFGEIGAMTLDQVQVLLADENSLGGSQGMPVSGVSALAAEDGTVRARTEDGREIRLKHGGKSVAAKLREAEEAKNLTVPVQGGKPKRKGRSKNRN